MPLTKGQMFAGYRIVRLLGSGGMGEVYLAAHPRLPRPDALKVLPADVSADLDYRARFNREADSASKLWHPHIVSVHDRGDFDGQLWISMDYVDGLDAARFLARRHPTGMPTDQVARIVTAVAGALDYAHKRGLLHRDVKPANIMLSHLDGDEEDQRIMLADFGIARNVDDISGLTATNMTVGTLAYAAPEQLMGEEIDGRADQYALAATAYHLLTARQLFPHSNPAVVISRHLNSPPPTLATTRPELAPLDLVLATALSKDPSDRFPRCTDFARAFTEQQFAMQEDGSPATTVQAPTGSKPSASSIEWRPVTVALAVVTVILIGIAALAWRPWQPERLSTSTSTSATSTAPPSQQPPTIAPPLASPPTQAIAGTIVFIDPGLSGANTAAMTQQVPNGRGGTTICQADSGSTDSNYPGHALTWDVALRIRAELTALGVRTALSRSNDKSVGPCVDQRAATANALHPNAIVTIHARGGPASGKGFHVDYSSPPLNDVQAGSAVRLARTMRDALVQSGLQPSTYMGSNGLYGRDDLAGLNLAQYPAVVVDPGNLQNSEDAADMERPDGRQKYADAITRGLAAFLSAYGSTTSGR